jgi:hydroxymethylpyrimidine pyrophosphatase-like HAD family hydrolase
MKKLGEIELLAVDVDGTLIGSDQIVPPEVVQAVADAAEGGLRVCLEQFKLEMRLCR